MVFGADPLPTSQIDRPAAEADGKHRPARRSFAARRAIARMDPEAAARQGRAVTLAFTAFGDSGAAMAFLNSLDATLGERPIDLAVASAEGLVRVAEAIAARTDHNRTA